LHRTASKLTSTRQEIPLSEDSSSVMPSTMKPSDPQSQHAPTTTSSQKSGGYKNPASRLQKKPADQSPDSTTTSIPSAPE
jgi:hypothetical protein